MIRGQGEIAAAGQTYPVNAGQSANATGTDKSVQVQLAAAAQPDALDQWSQQRDLKEDNSVSAKYVNRDTVGYSDLDDYGTWKEEPTYGSVWVPNNVPVGWSPYSDGYWNWVNPWGWTWVDYAPWGFAPYHYGRWNYFGGYWGWCPGSIYARPFYGPAFVGFVGGFGFGFGFGFGGGVGWFPLGWGEPFHPWYHCGPGYWHNVNVRNTYIRNVNVINNHNYNYAYAHNPHAVTATSRSSFVNGASVHNNRLTVNEASLRGARVTNGVNASPNHSSYFGAANARGHIATPSANIQNRSVVARTAPAAGASHLQARTMNAGSLRQGHFANTSATGSVHGAGMSQGGNFNRPVFSGSSTTNNTRQAQLSANRPPSSMTQQGTRPGTSSPRSWNAQGNVTDSGHAPQGFGGNNRSSNAVQSMRTNDANRPPWARGNSNSTSSGSMQRNSINRPPATYNGNRAYTPPSYNGNRGNTPPSYNGNRNYSAPRSYSPSSPRMTAPRSYSAPSAPHGGGGYSAPHNSGGGGGAPHSGGGGGGGGHPHR